MSDPILIEPSDLDLYASEKVCALQEKIKECVPEKDSRPNLWGHAESYAQGRNDVIDELAANLIAAGLMEEEQ